MLVKRTLYDRVLQYDGALKLLHAPLSIIEGNHYFLTGGKPEDLCEFMFALSKYVMGSYLISDQFRFPCVGDVLQLACEAAETPTSNTDLLRALNAANLDSNTTINNEVVGRMHLAFGILKGAKILLLINPSPELMHIVSKIGGLGSLVISSNDLVLNCCTHIVRYRASTFFTESYKHKCVFGGQVMQAIGTLFNSTPDKSAILAEKLKKVEMERESLLIQERQAVTNLHNLREATTAQIDKLNRKIFGLEQNIKSLQQENFDLRSAGSNMAGSFPTLEEVVSKYSTIGQQHIVEFILNCEDLPQDEVVSILLELFVELDDIFARQRRIFFNTFAPASVAISNALQRELITHLQGNYKTIMNLKKFLQRKKQNIVPDVSLPGFEESFFAIACKIHKLLWIVELSPNLCWASDNFEYTKQLHQNLLGSTSPVVILPPLKHEGKIIAQGFAM